ncbi:hypothetical protein [Halomonas kalidii]|uniref:Helix-turn-helix domain-containing protein n=1 Tax=Halomonas kalidii TaxID=3043293 RepID=A0ABT6VQA8_9GAMM|nr:hypothetical protein [Halomonas kalidii]MDI5935432.1 hypothetical protein [Halomonas kalidii]
MARHYQERRLIRSLTAACEQAKQEVPGFAWVTHVDTEAGTPCIVWVFDTPEAMAEAMAEAVRSPGQWLAWSRQALFEAGLRVDDAARWVGFDNEAACRRHSGGNWTQQLQRHLPRRR